MYNSTPLTASVIEANRRTIQAEANRRAMQAGSLNPPLRRTSEVRRSHRSNEQAASAELGESPSFSIIQNGQRIIVQNLIGRGLS